AYILKTDGRKKGGYDTRIDADKDGVYFYEPWVYWGVSDNAPRINPWPKNIDYKSIDWVMYNTDQNYKDRDIESSGYIKKIGKNTGSDVIVYKTIEYNKMNLLNIKDRDVINHLFSSTDTTVNRNNSADTTEFQFIP